MLNCGQESTPVFGSFESCIHGWEFKKKMRINLVWTCYKAAPSDKDNSILEDLCIQE